MNITAKQTFGLLDHPESPYIRAGGFLYLRYAAVWGWFEPYIKDEYEFSPGSNDRMATMGVYYYLIASFHASLSLVPTRGSDDTARRPPSVKASLSVSFGQRAPHLASTRDSSPVRYTNLPPYDRNYNDVALVSPYRPCSRCQELADREYGDQDEDRVRDIDGARGRECLRTTLSLCSDVISIFV
ncbi:hypothetical protein POM88_019271 [Heracleum sosnowskyi]|uniref:Pre-mRNA-splicing factor 38 n=1 Tax=Heracleum sosnowskyi TaxID=360622 RepID=A0AAD8IU42_9APIA|nr:hypothetical protein POM88_019271 [Heracleum sosnowskyi]